MDINNIPKIMFKLMFIGIVCSLSALTRGDPHPINEWIVAEIRSKGAKWEAHDPATNPFANKTNEELLKLCGSNIDLD